MPGIQKSIWRKINNQNEGLRLMEANYRLWRQYDDEWNQKEAWPEAEFPHAKSRYMKKTGCFITSMAILLRLYNIEKETDPNLFNPLILCKNMQKIGAYDCFADIRPESFSRLYPIEYLGSIPYSYTKLVELLKQEQPCLVMVPGLSEPFHYIVPDAVLNNDVKICDPGFDKEYLSDFSKIFYIVMFRNRGFISENTVKFFSGSITGIAELCREFGVSSEYEYSEKDVLVKAFDKWGKDIAKHLHGDYVAVLRNAREDKLYLFRSMEGKQELLYCICEGNGLVYGSESYITSSEAYCSVSKPPMLCQLTSGQCVEYYQGK